MNIAQIEINLQNLIKTFDKEAFIYELLLAYGLPKASITRLKKGNLNLSTIEGEISWKKKLFFKAEFNEDLHLTISGIAETLKHSERFVIVTDYKTLLAIDTKTEDKLDCAITDLAKHYDFFLPWAGMEKAQHADENPADVKAAEKMAKLFDEIKKDNPDDSPEFIHGLNVFLSRLLFCFFAEDTHIFEENQFTNAIDSHTQMNGSDLNTYLDTLFTVLNTPKSERQNLPEYLNAFPFVNGGLFKDEIPTPKFSRNSRNAILTSGKENWSAINPDIFGSMFQAVISVDQRGSLGQHYTSVPNIMKVIEPLFLNDLYEELEKAGNSANKLSALLHRIHHLKIFDPACGSGNFLIIAYKELRILEMKIFKADNRMVLSGIQLAQFYGIEIDDFAGEIAKLALWLAEHQMNVAFFNEFGRTNPTLPLKEAGKIVQGNACRLDWEVVCPKEEEDEIYILGNPPYLGGRMQNSEHKEDLALVYKAYGKPKKVDYITCWFFKASEYIKNINSKYAFVTTNSICQGEQVSMIWSHILNHNLEISFAYTSFKWTNNAKGNAGVTVSIIGVRNIEKMKKIIFINQLKNEVKNINPYLANASNIFIQKQSSPMSLPFRMEYGNMAIDGGYLILSPEEKDDLINNNPFASQIIKQIYGAQEFLNGVERFCLWIKDEQLDEAIKIPEIAKRISLVKEKRLAGNDKGSIQLAKKPHQFREMKEGINSALIVPTVSSERRKYIPVNFIDTKNVIIAPNQAIYDPEPYIMGIITSRMHMTWMRAVAGRLEERYRYSSTLVYNTFPFPPISTQRKNEITQSVFRILEEREKHSDKTLADLYDPDKMPEGLREAHRQNDEIIEKCYRSTPFNSDEERLEYLFKLYEKMIAEEQAQGTLFAKPKKTRKKKK
jgi:type I restriction-modification system DNA methylase subunit